MIRLAIFMFVIGGMLGYFGYKEYRISKLSTPQPEDIALDALIKRGPHGNAHVRLKEFTFCDNIVYSENKKTKRWEKVYIPVVPGAPAPGQIQNPKPGAVQAIIVSTSSPTKADVERFGNQTVIQGLITNYIDSMGSQEEKLLKESYPGTDVANVLLIEAGREPAGSGKLMAMCGGGAALLLGGVVVLLIRAARGKEG
jgi:hypothetical protein